MTEYKACRFQEGRDRFMEPYVEQGADMDGEWDITGVLVAKVFGSLALVCWLIRKSGIGREGLVFGKRQWADESFG